LFEVNVDSNWDITIQRARMRQGDDLVTTIARSGPEMSESVEIE